MMLHDDKELSILAFTEIPEEKDVAEKFKKLVSILSLIDE